MGITSSQNQVTVIWALITLIGKIQKIELRKGSAVCEFEPFGPGGERMCWIRLPTTR